MPELLLDAAGRRRSPATLPDFHAGRPPRNKGIRYPRRPTYRRPDRRRHARRRRRRPRPPTARARRRALARRPAHPRGARTHRGRPRRAPRMLVRRGKGGRRREVGMDDWAFEQLAPWLKTRVQLPVGPLFCVVNGPTRGRPWSAAAAPLGAAARRLPCRRATTLRAPSAAPRSRRRDGPRGRAASRHPTPTRPHQPRHHVRLPTRDRQHRDHRHRPRAAMRRWSPSTARSVSELLGGRGISAALGCPSRPDRAANRLSCRAARAAPCRRKQQRCPVPTRRRGGAAWRAPRGSHEPTAALLQCWARPADPRTT